MIADIYQKRMDRQLWFNQENKVNSLLKNPQKQRCEQCLSPLSTLTKIISIEESYQSNMVDQNKECKILCLPCFCGYRSKKEEIGQIQPIKHRYFVWKRIDLAQQELNGWSPFECFELFACLQKFGNHIDQEFCQELPNKSGKRRNIKQVEEQYTILQNQLFGHGPFNLNIKETQLLGNPLITKQSQQKEKFIQFLNLSERDQLAQAERFLSLINYDCSVELLRKYPDNLADYMARVVATNPVVKQNLLQSREFSNVVLEKNNTWLTLLLYHQLNERDETDRLNFYLTAKYCQKFIIRKKSSKIIEGESKEKVLKRVCQMSHPQISELVVENRLKEQFTKLIELRKKRVQFFEQIKEKSKEQGRKSARNTSLSRIDFPIVVSSGQRGQEQQESEMIE